MSTDFLGELKGLENTLNFHSQRHNVLASNLSNADTPNYIPKDLTFSQNMLAAPMQLTDPAHVSGSVNPQYTVNEVPGERHFDGSGVEMEQAMSQLTANRLRYETGIEMTRRRLGMLRYAAGNGGAA
jgi:flagellar basal-body rod protein FlgB